MPSLGFRHNLLRLAPGVMIAAPAGASGLLLDDYTAVAAYSLRKLRTAYAGSAIRVRRSSDNAEQDIGFSGNSLDESALTTFVGAGDGYVVTWYDQSGQGHDIPHPSTSLQPQIVTSGAVVTDNMKPAIEIKDNRRMGPVTWGQVYSQPTAWTFVVNKTNHSTYLFDADAISANRQLQGNDTWINAGTSVLGAYPSENLATQVLFTALFNGASSVARVNGSQTVNGDAGTNGSSGFQTSYADGNQKKFWGKIQEIIVFAADVSSGFTTIETDINSHYAIF